MKQKKQYEFAGFAGRNEGKIENCYSEMKVKKADRLAGFSMVNSGEISACYARLDVKKTKKAYGMLGESTGKVRESFFSFEEKQQKRTKVNFEDTNYYVNLMLLNQRHTFSKYKLWNFEDVWQAPRGETEVFFPAFRMDAFKAEYQSKRIHLIKNEKDLLRLAKKVNDGEMFDRDDCFQLKQNIDLKGKKWIPIGTSVNRPFMGTFDGGGHCISNFTINGKKYKNAGFFGYIRDGIVMNLDIDGIIKNADHCGGLAAVNDKGFIACCGVQMSFRKCQHPGGLVGINYGSITHCYVKSNMKKKFLLPAWLLLLLLLLIVFLLLLLYFLRKEEYPPIPVEPNAIRVDVDDKNNDNAVDFILEKTITFKSGQGSLRFTNPGKSGKNVQLELHITDEELFKKTGSTGRSAAEQKKLGESENYKPASTRTIIAQSGLIEPGYQLESIELKALPNSKMLPKGTYDAIVYLKFYDRKSNEKAIMDSQLAVKVKVK